MGTRETWSRRPAAFVAFAMVALVATLALAQVAAVAAAQSPPSEPPFPARSIGVVGCSNTSTHVEGYLEQSQLGQLTSPRLGGLSFEMWGDPTSKDYDAAWRKYDGARPVGGYGAAWVQMCLRVDDDRDPHALLTEVVSQIRQRDDGIPVYVSPINEYAPGHVCGRIGPDGFAIGQATVEWGLANLEIEAGPVTGPLAVDMLGGDGCHIGPTGVDLVGGQLVAWFDEGGWGGGEQPPPGADVLSPALGPWCAAVDPLATLGVIRRLAACNAG